MKKNILILSVAVTINLVVGSIKIDIISLLNFFTAGLGCGLIVCQIVSSQWKKLVQAYKGLSDQQEVAIKGLKLLIEHKDNLIKGMEIANQELKTKQDV